MVDASSRINELQAELSANPSSRQFYQLGELLRREGRAAEAAHVLLSGLAHHPRYVAAWVALGRAFLESEAVTQAEGALEQALALDTQNPVAWRLLGETRLARGDRFGALDAMQHALDLAPGDQVIESAVQALSSQTAPPLEAPIEEAPYPESDVDIVESSPIPPHLEPFSLEEPFAQPTHAENLGESQSAAVFARTSEDGSATPVENEDSPAFGLQPKSAAEILSAQPSVGLTDETRDTAPVSPANMAVSPEAFP